MTLFNIIQDKNNRHNTLDNLFYDRDVVNDISVNYGSNLACLTYYTALDRYIQLVNPDVDFLKKKKSYFSQGLSVQDMLSKGPILKRLPNSQYISFYSLLDQDGKSNLFEASDKRENPIRKYEFKEQLNYSDPFRGFLKPFGENLFTIVQENPRIKEWITTFFEEFNLEFLMDFSSKSLKYRKKKGGLFIKFLLSLRPIPSGECYFI